MIAQVPERVRVASRAAVGTLDEKESRAYGDGAAITGVRSGYEDRVALRELIAENRRSAREAGRALAELKLRRRGVLLRKRDLTDDDLEHRLAERRHELFNLRFQSVTGALENSARLKLAKREIARILTVVNEREAEKAKAS